MRRFLPTFLLIILVLMVYPFIGMDEGEKKQLAGLPWQVDILPDGYSSVFGISPGKSTLADATVAAVLGQDFELGIISGEQGVDLEMYYGHYRVGLMSAKIVLGTDVDAATLEAWLQRSESFEYMKTGEAKKHFLTQADREAAMSTVITSITFIPAVNLDDEIIRKRFGEPTEVIAKEAGLAHYLYADKGLDIILSDESKEVLQFVAPADFGRLQAPLQD